MVFLNSENQMLAIEKVLEEMQKAEETINSWNAMWWEEYVDCVLPQEYFDRFHWENEKLDSEISKIDQETKTDKYNGIPLKSIVLGDKYNCDIGTIYWHGIKTNNSIRRIVFHNDGSIYLEKNSIKNQTEKRPRRISYNASYNVLLNDFNISIILDQLTNDWIQKYQNMFFLMALKDNVLTERFDNIEIVKDFHQKTKLIKITKKVEEKTVIFEGKLDTKNNVEIATITINTHKGNGKINGIYKIGVNRKKGIFANFYSRKGVKFDLTIDPILLNTAREMLLSILNAQKDRDDIIADFVNSFLNIIDKILIKEDVNFDNFEINMATVKQIENRIIEMIKSIKGELPLQGLIQRIDNCLNLNDIENRQLATTRHKTLKLDLKSD